MSPIRLRPTGAKARDAVLVGDPGRALRLAQVLLEQPMMTNHARGLWGYTAESVEGRPLTLQATGMGGPSAATVFSDLVKLGVERAVRVGTCRAIDPSLLPGSLIAVSEAHGRDGASRAVAGIAGAEQLTLAPDPELSAELAGKAEPGPVVSVDLDPGGADRPAGLEEAEGAGTADEAPGREAEGQRNWVCDMQTAAVLATAQKLEVRAAAILIVEWAADGERLPGERLEQAVATAGRIAAATLAAG